jgi:hypothetical protein
VTVVFHEHVRRAVDLAHRFGLYGIVADGPSPRERTIDLFRPTLNPSMREQLTQWERLGLLRWSEATRVDAADESADKEKGG